MTAGRLTSVAVAIVGLGLAALAASLGGEQESAFPHEAHQGLFPLCTGCHEGVPLGEVADFYPEPASCGGCHDGVREVLITWRGPSERIDNVAFDHQAHAAELATAGDPPQDCAACHIAPGGGRLEVADAVQLATCWSCHAHEAAEHEVDADCSTCHVPIAETRFDRDRLADLPVPSDHDAGAFLDTEHGRLAGEDVARCATCHTQERCTACHVDTERDAIASMPVAPPGMDLPVAAAHYNVPADHESSEWLAVHGLDASREQCATCHTSNDCMSCHVAPAPEAVAALPRRENVVAPGVLVVARPPDSHGRMFFMQSHPTLAAAGDASCATCHVESFCVSCHDAPVGGGYHPANFVSRHTASAFGRDSECTNCHNTQAFCRQCHVQVGLTPAGGGRLGPGYHDDGPLWLLRHGQGARQNLESCASCHRQVDCTQCHGVLGAFKVSPHTAAFDAERAWSRSPRTCLACHIGNPLNGAQP